MSNNDNGEATTGNETLPYGTYDVCELRKDASISAGDVYDGSDKLGSSIYANESMLFAAMEERVNIRYQHEMIGAGTRLDENGNDDTFADDRLHIVDEPVRGGVHVFKADYDTGSKQGNAPLSGVRFAIVNRNEFEVSVDGETYATDKVVKIITTNSVLGILLLLISCYQPEFEYLNVLS